MSRASGCHFQGDYIKTLKQSLNLNDSIYLISGTTDPSSVAVDAPIASVYFNTSTGNLYRKTDAGSSTNWVLFSTNVSVGTFGSTPNSAGASVSGQVLTLQPADGTNPGGISTAAQTIAGAKTFSSPMFQANGSVAAPSYSFTNATNMGALTKTVSGSNLAYVVATEGVNRFIIDKNIGGVSYIYFDWKITGQDGAVSAPAFSFFSDMTAGLYRTGTGSTGIAGSGVAQALFDPTGLTLPLGFSDHTRVVIASGAITVIATDSVVVVNKTVGAATAVNLPASPTTGRTFKIVDGKGDAATNNITITPAAGTINGSATYVMNVNYQAVTLVYNGTEWNLEGDYSAIVLGTGVSTFLATPSSANLATAVTDETGSGALVFANTPTLIAPLLGTPTSGTLSACTGLPISTGVSGLGSDVAAFLATPSSANLITAVTDETGSGALVFANTPTLIAPILGTPTSGTLSACTGLPISTGVSGLGSNVATFLATPSSANLAAALTDETGSGVAVFATSPTITTPRIVGVTDASNATAGDVGQYQESKVTTNTDFPAAIGSYGDATSITLAAGDWMMYLQFGFALNSSTVSEIDFGISTTSGNSSSGLTTGDNKLASTPPTALSDSCAGALTYRVSVNGSTTYYAKLGGFGGTGTPQYVCKLSAVRIR